MTDEAKQDKPKRKRTASKSKRRGKVTARRRRSGGRSPLSTPLGKIIADAYLDGMSFAYRGGKPTMASIAEYVRGRMAGE